ncbi:MAG: ABC transporter ATP-binding protein [Lachnospiraceae bacterium]|nr:ABC transporter ATP-binding protein [Lachnospiraceae bacterium]
MSIILNVKSLNKKDILHDVSLDVRNGEMVAVMGPSGSGKSTLLYNISGMDKPDSGYVMLNGKDITTLSEDESARLRLHEMGFVFQQMHMIDNLNIIDNILLPAIQADKEKKTQKIGEKALTAKAQKLMQTLSIGGLDRRRITEVSGGQLQRACICRSLMNDPVILFADEPTGALNQNASADVMNTLVSLNKAGTTIFMVTHDSRMASHCGRILYLEDGHIQGELVLKNDQSPKEREDSVNNWLQKMNW